MTGDNPFEHEKTLYRPNPGGRRAEPTNPPPGPPSGGGPQTPGPTAIAASPPAAVGATNLPSAAAPFLLSVVRLRQSPQAPDLNQVRERCIQSLQQFESTIRALCPDSRRAEIAHYLVCATADDLVMNTPWGRESRWSQMGMVASFHRQALGGDHFYDIMQDLQRNLPGSLDLLALSQACLAVGFRGRLRLSPHGEQEAAQIRANLHSILRANQPVGRLELAPNWRGVTMPAATILQSVSLWVGSAMLASVLAVIFLTLYFTLNAHSDTAADRYAALPPVPGPVLVRAPPPPPELQRAPRIAKFLEKEIAEGLVTVTETMDSLQIRLRNRGMFAPGSADLESASLPIVARIAEALKTETENILIVGHTDNQPIRSTRFPSNWQLSIARAESVARLIAAGTGAPEKIKSAGRADREPVAGNDTPEGREQNRRIDVVLIKDGTR